MRCAQNLSAVRHLAAVRWVSLVVSVVVSLAGDLGRELSAGEGQPVVLAQVSQAKKSKAEPKTKKTAPAKKPSSATDDSEEANDAPATPPPMEYETVKLADGTKIQVEKWGETFLGYDYQPPIEFPDPRLREIVQYEKLGHPNLTIRGMQVDSEHKRIYWCDGNSLQPVGHLWGADLTGSNIKMLSDNLAHPRNLMLDGERGKLYWLEGMSQTGALMTCDIHGRNTQTLIDRLKTPHGLALDVARDELYYFEQHHIVRVKTDGSGETLIVNGTEKTGNFASAMEFDAAEDRLYWVVGDGLVRRVNRDGTDFVDHVMNVTPMGDIQGFALGSRQKKSIS